MKMFGADSGDLLMWGDVIIARAHDTSNTPLSLNRWVMRSAPLNGP